MDALLVLEIPSQGLIPFTSYCAAWCRGFVVAMSDAEGNTPSSPATGMAGVQRRKGTAAPVTEQEEALGYSWDQLGGLVCPTDSTKSGDREHNGALEESFLNSFWCSIPGKHQIGHPRRKPSKMATLVSTQFWPTQILIILLTTTNILMKYPFTSLGNPYLLQ